MADAVGMQCWTPIDGAEIGMTHNIGGTGGTAAVHIFGRDLE